MILKKENWINSRNTDNRMMMLENLYVPSLNGICNINKKSLVLRGKEDIMCSEEQVSSYMKVADTCKVEVIENCKHWIRIDKPTEYADKIISFYYDSKSCVKEK